MLGKLTPKLRMDRSRFASSKMIESKRQDNLADLAAGCVVVTCGGRRSYDAAVWTTFGRVEWRQIETAHRKRLSHGCEAKRRVTIADLAAGSAVGRDAAERRRDKKASSRLVADGVPTTPRSGRLRQS
ncbi:MAG: hypothetical protein NT069_02285 [Planctomycetota bacterium]|nr:hypothetical protein [Planctomycetota bacterium]